MKLVYINISSVLLPDTFESMQSKLTLSIGILGHPGTACFLQWWQFHYLHYQWRQAASYMAPRVGAYGFPFLGELSRTPLLSSLTIRDTYLPLDIFKAPQVVPLYNHGWDLLLYKVHAQRTWSSLHSFIYHTNIYWTPSMLGPKIPTLLTHCVSLH